VDKEAAEWWSTDIIEMSPGVIRYRGYAIEDLIGNVGFAQMIWLMLRGELPSAAEADLLETALMAAVDHGPQAPSIAIARMAATCGVGLNSAMASGVNVLGDVHGGAGEQALALYNAIAAEVTEGGDLVDATGRALDAFEASGGKYVPGFGHRFHPIDPRAPRLMSVTAEAAQAGTVKGQHRAAPQESERQIAERKGRGVPMNIAAATAAIRPLTHI